MYPSSVFSIALSDNAASIVQSKTKLVTN